MSNTHQEIPPNLPTTKSPAQVNVTFGADAVIMIGVLLWALWDRFARPTITKKLDGVFAPIEEERRLSNILAQIGVISGASRVILAAFHNGSLDNLGYHLQKMSVVNTYVSDNATPMKSVMKDIPIGKVMNELEQLIANEGKWVCTKNDASLPETCREHLQINNIDMMYNRLVSVGNLPIGILSIQYMDTHNYGRRKEDMMPLCEGSFCDDMYDRLIEDLYNDICNIMRRRVVHPGWIKKLFMKISFK